MQSWDVLRCTAVITSYFIAAPSIADVSKEPLLPNTDFTQGDDAPDGWTLSGGGGRWIDRQLLKLTGSGSGSNQWRAECRFEPGELYRFEMRAQGTTDGGCITSGPDFANCDHRVTEEWNDYGHVFRVPDGVERAGVHLGQWNAQGNVQFDRVRLVPVMPAHLHVGELVLGEGEIIRNGRYTFSGTLGGEGGNYHRPLESATARFNSNRWCFGNGDQVTYRFELPGHKFTGGELRFNVCWHAQGECVAEVSADGEMWQAVATQGEVGTAGAKLPESLLPASRLFVRLTPASTGGSFQVDRITFAGQLNKAPADAVGQTLFAEIRSEIEELSFEWLAIKDIKAGTPALEVSIHNNTRHSLNIDFEQEYSLLSVEYLGDKYLTGPGKSICREFLLVGHPGENSLVLSVTGSAFQAGAGGVLKSTPLGKSASVAVAYRIPEFHRADYGELLNVPGNAAVWWCPSTHKIPRQHFPLGSGKHVRLSAARNDREAVQIAVKPKGDLHGLTAEVGPFTGPAGNTIAAEATKILRVAYHFVEHPTDKTGVRDFWPDALPPLSEPIDVPAGQNQPLWVLVHVPKDAEAGDYEGVVSLKAEGFEAEVPLKLHVWDFTLPDRNHLETAFGLSQSTINRYHQLKTEEDKRRVWDMYLEAFAEHRLSPYDPVPMDPIRVHLKPDADPPTAEVDFSAFDPAFERALEKYHFTTYRLPVRGMGGGTFHSRIDPKIGKYGAETPKYREVFSSYMGQLESHFRDRGWLDVPYIYWFDEPAPKDYEFVCAGFERLKRHAPALRTMLTEQPEEALAGPVDIWCPVSHHYDHEAAKWRRNHGEQFWWYVCCGPKEPYCTLFIDHPATELRVWLWQAWRRGIDGILVWSTNYWTSSAAFPDPAHPQNPYEDPMGYRSSYGTPKGVKAFWGNGDGRFLYPPESAAVPGLSGPGPVIEPPVSCIRLEMLREGIEDWEYLYLLRDLIERRKAKGAEDLAEFEALLEVPESITRGMTTFTTDPGPIYERRREVAEAIERLGR